MSEKVIVALVISVMLIITSVIVVYYVVPVSDKRKAEKVYNRMILNLQEQVTALEQENRRLRNWLTFCNAENAARISEGYETQIEVLQDELRKTKMLKNAYAREFERRGIVVKAPRLLIRKEDTEC